MSLDDILLTIPVDIPLPSSCMEQVEEFVAPISADDTLSADEQMSLDDILLTIPVDIPLPSSCMEVTKITMGKSIKIPGVSKWSWFLKSLPHIPAEDKGKEVLVEKDPVKGNPAAEHYSLICADIELLVNLRAQKGRASSVLGRNRVSSGSYSAEIYILLKYRTVLVWKFLDAWRANFVPGQGSSAVDIQVIELLSDLYLTFLEELAKEARAHNLIWNKPCCSKIFEGSSRDRGAVIARTNSNTRSLCWIRKMILVDGLWTVELCADKWVKIPRKVISTEVPRQRQFDDTLPSMSVFFRLMKKIWADICLEGNDFWRSSCQLSLFVNRRQVPESVVDTDFDPHGFFIEPVQYWGAAPSLIKTCGWARVCIEIVRYSMFWCLRPGVYTDSFVGYFSGSDVESIAEIDLTSSDGSTVYRSPSPQVESSEEAESVEPIAHLALGPVISGVAQEEQSYFVEIPESPPPAFQHQETSILSSDSPVHFNSDDIPLDDTADVQTTFPAVTVDLSPLLDDLKISLSQHMDNAQSDILSRLHTIERGLRDTLGQQNEYFRNLIQSARQDGQNQDDIQTLRFNEFKKVVLAQGVTAGADSVEVRKEIKALDAKINSLDGQVVAIKSEQLEFQTKTAADLLSLSTQLGDIVDYIRGGDAKKGEGSSSRRPLPPPVNQGEGSGGDTVRTTDIAQRDIDNAQRNILERIMAADRQREREMGSQSRSGSHKRRRY
ncbi:nuclear matrix constituent protein 1-like protein-like [Dorcoceras hygrometricum]|uniref:Nuclear matrix constituent protein 1-like protein-like n=1 Tax=Dorcoceras hygrometricum TaxID=472368 RepID=A0A2Z7CHD5_9LAMI|nr:nuclear matrix constituent protein 1-like protein-like [Dorcoceras hygrometricum]